MKNQKPKKSMKKVKKYAVYSHNKFIGKYTMEEIMEKWEDSPMKIREDWGEEGEVYLMY